MNKILILILAFGVFAWNSADGQTKVDKRKKSKYYKNNTTTEDFDVVGYEGYYQKRSTRKDVEEKAPYRKWNIRRRSGDEVGRYKDKVKDLNYGTSRQIYRDSINTIKTIMTADVQPTKNPKVRRPITIQRGGKNEITNERMIHMTPNEREYATTVVRKRYTNLDVLADDLDLSKWQIPVFKGICSECDRDVDDIIVNKDLSSLEKNYRLKQSYMLRDKRLRETLEDGQYRKWLRIKDSDEYLILTKDPELIDGVYK